MQYTSCCFTGHRNIPQTEYETIEKRLEREVTDLITQGVTHFYAGGALGFDTMAAKTVLKLRKTIFPGIKLILVLPCIEQADRWSEDNRKTYNIIRIQADEVIYTSWANHSGCMRKRNRKLVEESDVCVCYLTKPKGGTVYTIKYAEKRGLKIINLA